MLAPVVPLCRSPFARLGLFKKRAQDGQVLHVLTQILALGCFQAPWMMGETRIVHDVAEGLFADLPLPDADPRVIPARSWNH